MHEPTSSANEHSGANDSKLPERPTAPVAPQEVGGCGGLDPARYGDWEKNGRCIDF